MPPVPAKRGEKKVLMSSADGVTSVARNLGEATPSGSTLFLGREDSTDIHSFYFGPPTAFGPRERRWARLLPFGPDVRYKVSMLDWIPEADLDLDHREALELAISMMIDEWSFDIADALKKLPGEELELNFMWEDLPEGFLATATPIELKRFLVCLIVVSYKLAQPEETRLSCTAEELCFHAVLARASTYLGEQGKTANYNALCDWLLEDVDAQALMGPDSALADLLTSHFGGANLDPSQWFLPFNPPRPALPAYVFNPKRSRFKPRVVES